jgi:small subunit ribosomal protein S9
MADEKPKRAKKRKVIVARGKRKEAIARATIREGAGIIRFNGLRIDAVKPAFIRETITEALGFVEPKYDIDVVSSGGGVCGQAQAARTAIAKGIVEFTGNKALRQAMIEHDRSLIVEDSRRVEPKKFKGPKARARFTKSYR